jgi:hypothetical protein
VADYTIVPVSDVPDMAAEVGMDPDHFEIRFMREPLGLKNFAVLRALRWGLPRLHRRRRSIPRLTTCNTSNLVRAPFTSPHRVRDVSCCGVELAGRRPG